MSLTSYRAAPPRVGDLIGLGEVGGIGRPGGDLLSRGLSHSTMGAGGFHGRVRDGIGCGPPAKATRSSNPPMWRVRPWRVGSGSGWLLCASFGRCVCVSSTVLVWMIAAHDGKLPGLSTGFLYAIEPIGRLGPVS